MRVLIVGHAWPQVDRRQQRPGRRLPPAQRRAALPPSLPSAHAGRALAAALAALRRALVDAAATANLLAHAAALAALAAAAPDLAARPLCRAALPPFLPSAHAGRALAAALAALRRVLVDAAATANLIAHAAALAALAAAAPDLAARPLCRSTAAVPVSGRVSFRVSCACTLPVLV